MYWKFIVHVRGIKNLMDVRHLQLLAPEFTLKNDRAFTVDLGRRFNYGGKITRESKARFSAHLTVHFGTQPMAYADTCVNEISLTRERMTDILI